MVVICALTWKWPVFLSRANLGFSGTLVLAPTVGSPVPGIALALQPYSQFVRKTCAENPLVLILEQKYSGKGIYLACG